MKYCEVKKGTSA